MTKTKQPLFNKQNSKVGACNTIKDIQNSSFEQIADHDEIPLNHVLKGSKGSRLLTFKKLIKKMFLITLQGLRLF